MGTCKKEEKSCEIKMVLLHQDLEKEVTPPDERIWENPDPRIQWALDILEPPGKYGQPPERIFNRFAYPVGGGALGAMVIAMNNMFRKIPVKSNIVGYAVMSLGGIYLGEYTRHYLLNYKA